MIKRIIALSTALLLMTGIMLPDVYADGGTQTPQLTVVGKRIKGDDNYFEISLEVNGDYEDYSSVGVVLQYDPSLIVPTTWDDEATPVDMSQSTDWASRRALPTLGKDTWTTHTALTYITQETNGENTKDVGYLYLGAEYPGILPNNSTEPSATTDPSATAAPTDSPTATPAATVDPDADKYANPVVVARFMYKDATAKAKIESQWTSAWDADWTQNKILTVAPDTISDASPAQFGFTIYKSDFSMKGFQHDYTTTVLEAAEQAAKTDIEIVLGEGESAKSGGLSLNDIYVVMFYDWDDSLLGTLTCGVGVDSSADINEYVKTKFIHPELQTQTTAQLTSTARVDNYRGEYPCIDPSSGAVFDDTNANPGSKYPLTNKLEYCFAGRDFNADQPFTGGWTKVTAENMEDTWTALDGATTFAKMPELGADNNPVNPGETIPDMVSVDFSDIKQSDIDGGTLMVKAVYLPGEMINGNKSSYYTAVGPLTYDAIGLLSNGVYSVKFKYQRVNINGYGVTRARAPKIRMSLTQEGATNNTYMSVDVENDEIFDVEMTPTKAVNTIGYRLVDTYNENIMSGVQISNDDDLGVVYNEAPENKGFIYIGRLRGFIRSAYKNNNGDSADWAANSTLTIIKEIDFRPSKTASYTTRTLSAGKTKMLNCVKEATIANDGECPLDLTYYQIQYYIIEGSLVPNSIAQPHCEANYSWCAPS